MGSHLVPNRECGPCNICCKQPVIPALKKPPGVLCGHWSAGTGCTIYEQRPGPCRSHFCAWRLFDQFDDSWRPDLSNIYAEVKNDPPERFRDVLPDATFAFKFTLLGKVSAHRWAPFITTIASLIDKDVPVILAVAAPPGHLGGYKLLNPDLKPLAATAGEEFTEKFLQVLQSVMDVPPALVPLD